jgi:peptidyl-prolyl cis-trans isomerase D
MLQLIRDKAQGIIIWIIVGLVILALSSFILNSYLASNVKTYVAKVNDQKISEREFQLALNNYQQQLRQRLGDNFPKFFNEKMMRHTVINGLIDNELMHQLTHDAGFRTSNATIANQLQKNENFKQGGKFSSKYYQEVLKRVGYTPAAFEAELAQSQAQQQFIIGLHNSAFILNTELDEYERLLREQRDLGYLLVNKTELRKKISVSDDEIKTYYQAHTSEFMTDEMVKVSYLELNMRDIAKSIKVNEDELKAYYQENIANYSKEDFASAEKKIKAIAARIKKGEDFAKLAKELSQDPGSAMKGGDLGFFGRGVMAKPFEDAAFKLKVGEVSKPVRTQFGYHIIKLEAIRNKGKEQRRARHILIKPGKVTEPFAEVKERVKQAVQLKKAERLFYEKADKLDRLSYEYQDSLDPAAEQLNVKIQQSPFFSRKGGAQIWHNSDVIKAAFSMDVLKDGLNSELIKLSDDDMLVLRLKEHKPAQQKPLEDVKSQIEARLKNEKARDQALALAEKLAKQIEAGGQPVKIADSNKAVSWADVGFIGRQPQYDANKAGKVQVSPEIRKHLFDLTKPDKQPTIASQQLGNGDGVVLVLRKVRENPPSGEKNKQQQEEALRRQLLQSETHALDRLLLKYERTKSQIDINQEKNSDQES